MKCLHTPASEMAVVVVVVEVQREKEKKHPRSGNTLISLLINGRCLLKTCTFISEETNTINPLLSGIQPEFSSNPTTEQEI